MFGDLLWMWVMQQMAQRGQGGSSSDLPGNVRDYMASGPAYEEGKGMWGYPGSSAWPYPYAGEGEERAAGINDRLRGGGRDQGLWQAMEDMRRQERERQGLGPMLGFPESVYGLSPGWFPGV